MQRHAVLIVLIAIAAIAAGCVGQTSTTTSAIAVRATIDPTQIRSYENATLFVDIENTGTADLPRVFVDAFDVGPLVATRALTSAVIGTLAVKAGVIDVQIGKNITHVITTIPCTRSSDCPDEDFGGCGSCVDVGDPINQCRPSQRSAGLGSPCEKQCECGQYLTCRFDAAAGRSLCAAAPRCADGSSGNACNGMEMYCTPWGDSVRACAGFDGFLQNVWSVPSGITLPSSDDCGCPGNFICRGDGTCAAPTGCYSTIYGLKRGEVQTLECNLAMARPDLLVQATTPVSVSIRAQFHTRLSGSLSVELLSRDEWRRRQTIGTLAAQPQSYAFADGNIQAVLTFDRAPPFVAGDHVVASLDIKSVGDGTISTLRPSDVLLSQPGTAMSCSLETPLYSEKGVFPSIPCVLDIPSVDIATTYLLSPTIYYDYELRRTIPISVLKT